MSRHKCVLEAAEALDVVRDLILPLLSVRSVARLEQVSQSCRTLVAGSDVWPGCLDRHLAACTYVPDAILERREGDPKGALQLLACDSSRRALDLDEMCSFEWCCLLAGNNFPLRFIFRADGSIVRVTSLTEARPHVSDSHDKQWSWCVAEQGGEGAQRVAVCLSSVHTIEVEVARHASGGFVMWCGTAVFTSWRAATQSHREARRADRLLRLVGVRDGQKRCESEHHSLVGCSMAGSQVCHSQGS